MDKSLYSKMSMYRHLQTNKSNDVYDIPDYISSDSIYIRIR